MQPRVLLLTVVTTYATDQHQALLGKQQGQPAQSQENNLGFLDRGEDYILPVLSRSCVWIYSWPGFSFEGMAMLEAAASTPSAVFSVQADKDKWLLFEAAEG